MSVQITMAQVFQACGEHHDTIQSSLPEGADMLILFTHRIVEALQPDDVSAAEFEEEIKFIANGVQAYLMMKAWGTADGNAFENDFRDAAWWFWNTYAAKHRDRVHPYFTVHVLTRDEDRNSTPTYLSRMALSSMKDYVQEMALIHRAEAEMLRFQSYIAHRRACLALYPLEEIAALAGDSGDVDKVKAVLAEVEASESPSELKSVQNIFLF